MSRSRTVLFPSAIARGQLLSPIFPWNILLFLQKPWEHGSRGAAELAQRPGPAKYASLRALSFSLLPNTWCTLGSCIYTRMMHGHGNWLCWVWMGGNINLMGLTHIHVALAVGLQTLVTLSEAVRTTVRCMLWFMVSDSDARAWCAD